MAWKKTDTKFHTGIVHNSIHHPKSDNNKGTNGKVKLNGWHIQYKTTKFLHFYKQGCSIWIRQQWRSKDPTSQQVKEVTKNYGSLVPMLEKKSKWYIAYYYSLEL